MGPAVDDLEAIIHDVGDHRAVLDLGRRIVGVAASFDHGGEIMECRLGLGLEHDHAVVSGRERPETARMPDQRVEQCFEVVAHSSERREIAGGVGDEEPPLAVLVVDGEMVPGEVEVDPRLGHVIREEARELRASEPLDVLLQRVPRADRRLGADGQTLEQSRAVAHPHVDDRTRHGTILVASRRDVDDLLRNFRARLGDQKQRTLGVSQAQRERGPASRPIDYDGLLCALILVPQSFSRNRFFPVFEDPEARRIRRRAARVRGVIRQLLGQGRRPGGELIGEQVLEDGQVLLRFRVKDLAYERTTALSALEAATLRYALHRAGVGPLDDVDRARVEKALQGLSGLGVTTS